jgi:hypothetical protein
MVMGDSEAIERCGTRPIMDGKLLFYSVFGLKFRVGKIIYD